MWFGILFLQPMSPEIRKTWELWLDHRSLCNTQRTEKISFTGHVPWLYIPRWRKVVKEYCVIVPLLVRSSVSFQHQPACKITQAAVCRKSASCLSGLEVTCVLLLWEKNSTNAMRMWRFLLELKVSFNPSLLWVSAFSSDSSKIFSCSAYWIIHE